MDNQPPSVLIAVDAGTTSCRAIAFDKALTPIATHQKSFTQHFPQSGWVEHDANEVLAVQRDVLDAVINDVGAQNVAAIGITNQRETAVAWSRTTGKPLCNAIVWQCRRTTPLCDQIRAQGLSADIRERTGLLVDPYFSATKWCWMITNIPAVADAAEIGDLALGTIDSWLIHGLTNGKSHVTDTSNASRTLVYNIKTQGWDPTLCDIFGVPKSALPDVLASDATFGHYTINGIDIPIRSVLGDQQAALFGQGCFAPGMLKCTLGTGSFLLVNAGITPPSPPAGILATIAWTLGDTTTYALEGSVFIAGAAVQWLRDGLGIIATSQEVQALATSVPDSGGVVFVPALSGLGAPYWNPNVRGTIFGITRGTTRAHIARATLDAIALQNADLVDAMRPALSEEITELRMDGGAAANDDLIQLHADFTECIAVRPACLETTALGAAALAGLASGLYASLDEISQLLKTGQSICVPYSTAETQRQREHWTRLVTALDSLDRTEGTP
ncbi:MAG: glycerol kinase GlpK [Armatimonadota bacterium]